LVCENRCQPTVQFGYNERDWLTSIADSANPANDATYAYDVNGNQIAKTQGGVTTGYVYDTRDQLVEVQTDGTLVESYDFSYDGLRTRKSGGGGLFRYVYDGRSLLLETDLAGNTVSKYEWGSDRLLSLNHTTEGRTFYLFDALGSPVSLSKPDGSLQARYLWDAWGNLRRANGCQPIGNDQASRAEPE
jgi:YD repeat-containing protein